jgi:hypothetical protein
MSIGMHLKATGIMVRTPVSDHYADHVDNLQVTWGYVHLPIIAILFLPPLRRVTD